MQAPLPEQYALVAQRYRELNETVAATQLEVHPGEWIASGPVGYLMAMRGNEFSGALEGEATERNSYYLKAFWRLEDVANAEAMLDTAVHFWDEQGWETSKIQSEIVPGEFDVSGVAPNGTQLGLSMMSGGVELTAFSGVYWGDREALAAAIWNIMQNGRNEGIDWRPERINDEGQGLIRPGEYAPYPDWNDIAYAERLEESPLWTE